MMTHPTTKRIRTEGRHAPLRSKARIILEVEHEIALMVEGQYLKAKPIQGGGGCEHTVSRIEVYEDRIQHVIKTYLRTPAHLDVMKRAQEMCDWHWRRRRIADP